MFHWTPEKETLALGLASTGRFTAQEIARRIGCERHTASKFLKRNNVDLTQIILTTVPLPEVTENSIIDLFESGQGLTHQKIAELSGATLTQVHRVIFEYQEEEWDPEADRSACMSEVAMLMQMHPDRRYEDAPEAEDEYPDQILPMRARTIAPYQSDEPARYKVDQSHTAKKQITLATSAGEFSKLVAA